MAESLWDCSGTNKGGSENEDLGNIECAVCLQSSVHPAKLPCGHIFCYLCVKGIVNQGRRCAMCRQYIPIEYLDKPILLKPIDVENSCKAFEDGRSWFYEGRNGWWQYDERSSQELESAYQKGEKNCELLIAGFLYIADFDAMLQYRKNDPSRKRKIKRDVATTLSIGVAGLKTLQNTSSTINSTTINSSNIVSNTLIQDLQNLQISGRPLNNELSDELIIQIHNL